MLSEISKVFFYNCFIQTCFFILYILKFFPFKNSHRSFINILKYGARYLDIWRIINNKRELWDEGEDIGRPYDNGHSPLLLRRWS